MKTVLKLEGAGLLILAVFLNTFIPFPWWWYWVLFLAPDISMLGYAVNSRIGALTYNLFHHQGVAAVIYAAGLSLASHELQFIALLILGHSAFDRVLGYGLKHADSFRHTHLGFIGRAPGIPISRSDKER